MQRRGLARGGSLDNAVVCMCPHTTICVLILLYLCPRTMYPLLLTHTGMYRWSGGECRGSSNGLEYIHIILCYIIYKLLVYDALSYWLQATYPSYLFSISLTLHTPLA